MNDVQERTFGDEGIGKNARGLFVVHRAVEPEYDAMIQRLFGNTLGDPGRENQNASALTVTDPTKWIFPRTDETKAAVGQERKKVKGILEAAGKYDQMIVGVHAPQKRYEKDALAVLKECSAIFNPKHLLLVVDSKSHTQLGGEAGYGRQGMRQEGEGPDGLIRIAENDAFFAMKKNLTIVRLDTSDPDELSKRVTKAIREILKA